MLDAIPNDPLTSLENCTLDEVISILQNYACDPLLILTKQVLALILQIML
jgi:hypothetical protein